MKLYFESITGKVKHKLNRYKQKAFIVSLTGGVTFSNTTLEMNNLEPPSSQLVTSIQLATFRSTFYFNLPLLIYQINLNLQMLDLQLVH